MKAPKLSVGQEIPPLVKRPIDRTQLVRYAGASGDFNRIHFDEPFAREAGHPSVIAHGMLAAAFFGQLLCDWVGPTSVRRLSVRFKSITYPGDVVTCRGQILELRNENEHRAVELRVWCEKQDGTVTAEGNATVVIR